MDAAYKVTVARVTLFPLDTKRFQVASAQIPPLTNLAPSRLLQQLAAEYVYAQLCDAAMQTFAAENQARMDAMGSASTNIETILSELRAHENRVRQEEVTAEIIELACSADPYA
jgi:F-type H+-transporting ATPase subunit gamma